MKTNYQEVLENPVLRLIMTKKEIQELIQLYQDKNNRTPDSNEQEG